MTAQKAKVCIAILEGLDPQDPTAYDKAVEAYKGIGKLPFLMLDLPNLPINIFHTRTHETDNYFEGLDEVSLPPEAAVKHFARCNVPGQPVFYCSDFRPTSYMELLEYWVEEKKEEFLYVTIGKWTIENTLKVLIVTSPYAEDRQTQYDKSHGDKLDHFINEQGGDMKEGMILLYKFLFERFRKPAKKDPQTYIITSAYCNFAFNQNKDSIDAILYPSVPYDGNGVNLAIKAAYPFEKNMKLILVARNGFKRIDTGPLPTFQETKLTQAKGIDYDARKIIW